VYLALTEEDVRKHSDEGQCIAVPVLQPDQQGDTDFETYAVGMIRAPYNPWLRRM
jgi:hypothetical protein